MKEEFPDKRVLDSHLYHILFEVPLYQEIKYDSISRAATSSSFLSNRSFRFFCPACENSSTFKLNYDYSYCLNDTPSSQPYNVAFECTMNSSHAICIIFSDVVTKNGDKIFHKIGQQPSLVDFNLHKIEKYKAILKKHYENFRRSIMLNTYGIGIGSYVYMRRIIEYLIQEAHGHAQSNTTWDKEEDYKNATFIKKISLLNEHLPEILVDNKKIYSALSKGVHEFSEEECLDFFPVLRNMVELILDEKLAEKEKLKKKKECTEALQKILHRNKVEHI